MKKRIIVLLAIVSLFALAIAAYAYTRGTTATTAASCCCKKDGDSCPMKGKGHDEKSGEHAKMSCCDKHKGDQATTEGHSCCSCCGDSCPMKKTDAVASESSESKSCCDNCDCCDHSG